MTSTDLDLSYGAALRLSLRFTTEQTRQWNLLRDDYDAGKITSSQMEQSKSDILGVIYASH